ncbi:MAG: S8 family serine peptidase, partial [Planctomycetota bacterium]
MARNGQRACIGSLLLVLSLAVPTWGGQSGPAGAQASPLPGLVVRTDGGSTTLGLDAGGVFHRTPNEVLNQRLIDVPDTSIRLVTWTEVLPDKQAVPFYAVSLDGQSVATVRRTSYALKLRHGDFDPGAAVPPVMPSLAADATTNLFIVQFVTQPLEEFRTAIAKLGGTVRHFLANHSHIVQMTPQVGDAVAALPYVRWVGPYHPAYRLEEFMRDNQAQAAELFPLLRYNIQVFEAGLGQKTAVAQRIEALGGVVDQLDAGKFLLVATLTPEHLFQVVRWDEIVFVDRWSPLEPDMNNARELGGANHIEALAGYAGAGVRGEAFDTGFNLSHVDFASRPLIQHGSVGSDSHGAATSGICFGDGTG